MANTYTQLRIHIIWVVKGRENMIPKDHREAVEKYITTCFQERKHRVLAIYCMPDHVHVFIGWHPAQSISELVGEVKTATTKFIKKQSWMRYNFSWQVGFAAFSYAKSQTDVVVKYVLNQAEHHKKRTFREEYLDMLQRFEVDYKEEYLFEFYD